jgi:hypothetical protein
MVTPGHSHGTLAIEIDDIDGFRVGHQHAGHFQDLTSHARTISSKEQTVQSSEVETRRRPSGEAMGNLLHSSFEIQQEEERNKKANCRVAVILDIVRLFQHLGSGSGKARKGRRWQPPESTLGARQWGDPGHMYTGGATYRPEPWSLLALED